MFSHSEIGNSMAGTNLNNTGTTTAAMYKSLYHNKSNRNNHSSSSKHTSRSRGSSKSRGSSNKSRNSTRSKSKCKSNSTSRSSARGDSRYENENTINRQPKPIPWNSKKLVGGLHRYQFEEDEGVDVMETNPALVGSGSVTQTALDRNKPAPSSNHWGQRSTIADFVHPMSKDGPEYAYRLTQTGGKRASASSVASSKPDFDGFIRPNYPHCPGLTTFDVSGSSMGV